MRFGGYLFCYNNNESIYPKMAVMKLSKKIAFGKYLANEKFADFFQGPKVALGKYPLYLIETFTLLYWIHMRKNVSYFRGFYLPKSLILDSAILAL